MLNEVIQTYPQPIAYAYGNVFRALSKPTQLDQIVRCAEVTARYLAALAISSFAAREDTNIPPPEAFAQFQGSLSFGHFLSVIQAVSSLQTRHPLQSAFSKSFLDKKSLAKGKLETLLELRNKIGHNLKGLSEASAANYFDKEKPLDQLEDMLKGILPLCSLPLFLVDTQKPVRRVMHVVRLLLMGEQNEPVPKEVAISEAFLDEKRLYLGTWSGVLLLHPMLIWGQEYGRAYQGIYLLHQISENQLIYESLVAFNQPTEPPISEELHRLLKGESALCEEISLLDGRKFCQEWEEQRALILSGQIVAAQAIPWTSFDQQTLKWYSNTLKSQVDLAKIQPQTVDWNQPSEVVRQFVLDGRGEVKLEEQRQLLLLFGTGQEIRRAIGRDVLDLRARLDDSSRWSDRRELAENILVALRQAVEFISQNNPLISELSSVNNLQTTVGSADYIAVRESLINLIIHQDYADPRTVAQIELVPHRTTMVNAGSSLISEDELANGGTSTARNPLIARALKLIGFAELGGSGLREVSRVWRNAKRRPPVVRSDEQNNRFRIELDSRPLKIIADSFWKQRLGVTVSPDEAKILALLGSVPEGLRMTDLCAGLDSLLSDTQAMCQRLVQQQLIDRDADTYRLKSHLQDLAQEIT
jgi:hypothetical protein